MRINVGLEMNIFEKFMQAFEKWVHRSDAVHGLNLSPKINVVILNNGIDFRGNEAVGGSKLIDRIIISKRV